MMSGEKPSLICAECNKQIDRCVGCGSETNSCGSPVCETCMNKRK